MFFLTPSKANTMNECPRCFYLEMHKILSRPRGIMSSVPGRIDTLAKERYDNYRLKNELPPEIIGKVYGKLFSDKALMKKMRHWAGPQKREFKDLDITLRGAIDDLVVEPDGTYSPLDYKSRGTIPPEGYGEKYYYWQMQFYALMLAGIGMQPSGKSYLVFYSFREIETRLSQVTPVMDCTVQTIKTDATKAKDFIVRASKLLKGPMPDQAENCEYCAYIQGGSSLCGNSQKDA